MNIDIIGKISVRYKEEWNCYNCKKKGHLTKQYRISKKEGNNWKPVSSIRITGVITTTISMSETKMLAVTEYKVTWIEVVQRIRQQPERDLWDDEAHVWGMVVILRHSGELSIEKVTEAVIIGSNRKIMEWIKEEVVTGGIQPSGVRTSSSAMDQIDIQEINNITVLDYNTIPA